MRNLVHSTAWVAYSVAYSSVSNLIVKHWHGLVTDCHRLLIVPIVPQSAPIVSVADVSVKLYRRQLQVKDLPKVPMWRLKRVQTRGPSNERRRIYQGVLPAQRALRISLQMFLGILKTVLVRLCT